MTTTTVSGEPEDLARDGIVARKAAFATQWVDRLHRDVLDAFEEARGREGGPIC